MKYFLLLAVSLFTQPAEAQQKKPGREYYELRVYKYQTAEQGRRLDDYLGKTLLPALHRIGQQQIGVFHLIGNDTARVKKIYLLIPYADAGQWLQTEGKLANDKTCQESGKAYISASYDSPPYLRMEISLLYAFRLAPRLTLPDLKGPRTERVYELRSYESATEKIFRNKVEMFNEGGEITLFSRLGFNAVFYAETISGSNMPNLLYMTTFENMASREAHWKRFSDDPEWKRLSALPQFQHNVSHADIIFLRPTEYSDY
jgi:hypothetical protein